MMLAIELLLLLLLLLMQLLQQLATSETSELRPDASEGAHHCGPHHCREAAYWKRAAASRKYNLEPKWLRSFRTSKHHEWVRVLKGFGKPFQGPLGEASETRGPFQFPPVVAP